MRSNLAKTPEAFCQDTYTIPSWQTLELQINLKPPGLFLWRAFSSCKQRAKLCCPVGNSVWAKGRRKRFVNKWLVLQRVRTASTPLGGNMEYGNRSAACK